MRYDSESNIRYLLKIVTSRRLHYFFDLRDIDTLSLTPFLYTKVDVTIFFFVENIESEIR